MSSLDDLRDAVFESVRPVDHNGEIARLAGLSTLEYGQSRDHAAKTLNVPVGFLDKAVFEFKRDSVATEDDFFPSVVPWPDPVPADALLTELVAVFHKFLICDDDTALAGALYCAMTWFVDVLPVAPLAIITAPEKRCGKSTALEIMAQLVAKPLDTSNISAAALFRCVDLWSPTLLIDEVDRFLNANEEAIGILNAGYKRSGAHVVRCVGDDHTPKKFSVWGAKVLCGIGKNLPDTVMDRAIVLALRRKLPGEQVARLRHAEAHFFDTLRAKLARFAIDFSEAVRSARPCLPDALNDRAQECWEPLIAIAELAGGDWPVRVCDTAVRISGGADDGLSVGTELLLDIREVFERFNDGRVRSVDLLNDLISDEEKPWSTYRGGKPINLRWLGLKLAGFGIKSKTLRFGSSTAKGYERSQFEDAFVRYLPDFAVTTEHSIFFNELDVTDRDFVPAQKVTLGSGGVNVTACDGTIFHAVTPKPLINKGCYSVTAKSGNGGVKDVTSI